MKDDNLKKMESFFNANNNMKKPVKINKNKKAKRNITRVLIGAATVGITLGAVGIKKQITGTNYIRDKFSSYNSEFAFVPNGGAGNIIYKDGVQVNLDDSINEMIGNSRSYGMSDAEINIGLNGYVSDGVADEYVPVSLTDKIAANEKAYHEYELEQAKNKGVSR